MARRVMLAAVAILAIALAVRAVHVARVDFPLNDGGLFFAMARDIQRSGYALPAFTSYNDGTIPFVYSPFALYVAAALDDLTPIALVDVLRWLPALAATGVVAAVLRLAWVTLDDRAAALAAAAAFALVPRGFLWLIMGGGLTRALGLAFAVLALAEAYRAFHPERSGTAPTGAAAASRARAPAVRAAALLALTAVTHLETAVFVGASCALFALGAPSQCRRTAAATLFGIGGGGLVLTAPWWGLLLARHGLSPWLSATDHGGSLLDNGMVAASVWGRLLYPVFTAEPHFPLVGVLGLAGAAYALARGRWLLPAWWLLIVVLDMRAYMTFAAVPTALLAGVAVRALVLPGRDGAAGPHAAPRRASRLRAGAAPATLVAGGLVAFALAGALGRSGAEMPLLRALQPDERVAMAWAAEHTPADARFVVVPRQGWYADRDGEWFPALARRESVTTVQGYEWIRDAFGARARVQRTAAACVDAACLAAVARGARATHVYVPRTCCHDLRAALRADAGFTVLYDAGALIAAVRDAAPAGGG